MRIKYMNQLVVFRHVKIRWRLKNLVTVSHLVYPQDLMSSLCLSRPTILPAKAIPDHRL